MLLKDNFIRLINLSLSRADFVLMRKVFNIAEGLANRKSRLHFLQQCSTNRVFPWSKTIMINNIKLPTLPQHT